MRPGNRYDRRKTLGDLIQAKLVLLAACRRCNHQSLIYPHSLIDRFGEDTPRHRQPPPAPLCHLPLHERQSARDRAVERPFWNPP
jgi:hypothetical protein